MSPKYRAIVTVLLFAGVATASSAQQSAAARSSDVPVRHSTASEASATPAVAGRTASYRSAFEGFKAFGDQPVLPWRESNNLVGRIGGWQAYAREGQGAAAADSVGLPAATSSGEREMPSMPAAHGGMTMPPSTSAAPASMSPAASPSNPAKSSMPMPARQPEASASSPQPTATPARAEGSGLVPGGASKHQSP